MSAGVSGGVEVGASAGARAGPDISLREMRWWDIESVLALEGELFPEDAWSEGMFWSELARARGPHATRRYLVVEAARGTGAKGVAAGEAEGAAEPEAVRGPGRTGGGLIGYGGLAAVAGMGDIQTLGILPAYRGTGLGARLLRALIRAGTDFECEEILLEVRVDNAPAQRLYERFGFAPVGIRRGYYQPGNVDALVMRLADPSTVPEPGGTPPALDGSPSPVSPVAPVSPDTSTPTSTPQGTERHG